MTNEATIILTDYEKYKENYSFRNRTGLAPQTRAIAFCMGAAGIKKLNTREDMHELILRMAILFKPMKMTETFFLKEYFFHFSVLGRNTFLIADDLQKHIGTELNDPQTEKLTRDEWLKKLGEIRWNRNVMEAMMHFINLSRVTWRMLTDAEDRPGYKWYYPRPGKLKMELNNASILADTIISKIDEMHFENYRECNNNSTAINETGNQSAKIELPLIRDRQPASETQDKKEEKPPAYIREELPKFIIEEMTPDKRKKAGYVAWPFAEGTARGWEYYGIDPRLN